MILEWLLKYVRIPKDALVEALEEVDVDKDGFISLGELIKAVRSLI